MQGVPGGTGSHDAGDWGRGVYIGISIVDMLATVISAGITVGKVVVQGAEKIGAAMARRAIAPAEEVAKGVAKKSSGTIYLRRNVATLEEYVGQAKPGRLTARQLEHAANHPGVQFEYDVLEEVESGTGRSLDVAEEDWIRAGGGPKRFGGPLANDRYQMSEKAYRAAGGTVPKPTN
jgi:hypothetical protein